MWGGMIHDHEYNKLLMEIFLDGVDSTDRTGVGTCSIFGGKMEFDISESFPLLTGKRLSWKSIAWELFWFMEGRTNNNWLKERGVSIWDEWAEEDGELGPVYGHQWRSWRYTSSGVELDIDQLQDVINRLKTNPTDRRLIVSAWNPADIPDMALPPCHMMYQFYSRDGWLDCQMYQRSCDMFLGVPYNIASYSLLTYIVAHLTGLKPRKFIWIGGDCHIYNNHMDQVRTQLRRPYRDSPRLRLVNPPAGLEGWTPDNCVLEGYNPHPSIKAPVAV